MSSVKWRPFVQASDHVNEFRPGKKWPPFCRRPFLLHFLQCKSFEFPLRFHWSLFPSFQFTIHNKPAFDSDNGLAPNSIGPDNGLLLPSNEPCITWTNIDRDWWRNSVSSGKLTFGLYESTRLSHAFYGSTGSVSWKNILSHLCNNWVWIEKLLFRRLIFQYLDLFFN